MADDRWTEETERLAGAAMGSESTRSGAVRAILTALADAGLLVEPDPVLPSIGLCGNRDDHEPHGWNSTVGRFWCHADQTRRLPYAAEVRRRGVPDGK